MFKRMILDDGTIFYTCLAFFVSASIFSAFLWRALRMKRNQVEQFENLPFAEETHSSRHDS